MKVLDRDPDGGQVILDPVRLPEIIGNAKRGFANGVLTAEHLVVSTISCSSHHECAGAAGIELDDIDWDDPVPGKGHLRLQFDQTGVEAEFWYDEEVYWRGTCPVSRDRLAAVTDWMAAHPGIVRAFGQAKPIIQVTLLHDGIRMWTFRDGEIRDTPDTPEPAADATRGMAA